MRLFRSSACALVAVIALAGCGGGDDDSPPSQAEADPAEIEAAAVEIAQACILSFGQAGGQAPTGVSQAVDDLISNFNADPDATLHLGALKADTPREALEGSVKFLANCSPSDADRALDALGSSP